MRFASYDDGSRDGRLLVVASDGRRAADAAPVASSLLAALEDWRRAAAGLQALAARLETGEAESFAFDPAR
jgi:fumarylacetoacetate (FAA) hydrolase